MMDRGDLIITLPFLLPHIYLSFSSPLSNLGIFNNNNKKKKKKKKKKKYNV